MSAIYPAGEFKRLRQVVLLGLFSGTGVGLGYLLAGVPGVELMSLNAALSGAVLGFLPGALVGVFSIILYSLGSPFGPPVPLLLASQAVGMAFFGLLGALLAPVVPCVPVVAGMALAAAAGFLGAVCLDLMTNVAAAVALDLPLRATLLAGLPVAALHAVTTAAAFCVLLPRLSHRLRSLLMRGPRCAPFSCLALLMLIYPSAASASDTPQTRDAAADSLMSKPTEALSTALVDTMAIVLLDTLTAPPMLGRPSRVQQPPRRLVKNWRRPLWQPFSGSFRQELQRRSPWLPIAEGGMGGPVVYFAEPGTSPTPLWTRHGLPLNQGHRYLDDPESIIFTGHHILAAGFGLSADGSLAGTVEMHPLDSFPDRDLLDTRWFKGAHESYLRDVHFLTAKAAWRLGFAFGELLDNEGYDFRTPGEFRFQELDEENPLVRSILWGRFKLRSGRGFVQRDLGSGGTVTFSLENVRKLKLALPAYGLRNQDLWHHRAALDWRTSPGATPGRLALWWLDTDADWNRGHANYRKQEGSSTGLLASWGDPAAGVLLDATWRRWTLVDSGADTLWARPDTNQVHMYGEGASLRATRAWPLGPATVTASAGSWWDEHGGWLLGGSASAMENRLQPRWSLALERGGRAPRSDELATAWRFVVPGGQQTVALPNSALGREREWRLAATLWSSTAGFDLALSAAARRLRDGIGWRPLPENAMAGRWDNGLALDSRSVRASLAREGECLGWLRLRADMAWRTWRQSGDLRVALPPAMDWRLSALWEQHFFQEDGILQLGWFLHDRSAMDDPWFLAEPFALPQKTSLDMIVAFRLLGADLGLEFLNLAGGGSRLSAGSLDHGLELRWRLHWVLHH